ncbi:MAG: hypothetical protein ACKN9F_04890 [Methylomonas sp.]
MGELKKVGLALVGAMIIGFIMVGMSKQQSNEEKESAAQIRTLVAMQEMANQKCPKLILDRTGTQVYFPSKTDTDKTTYVTMEWLGEADSNFKVASCTLKLAIGGVSKLVIDDKVLIDK